MYVDSHRIRLGANRSREASEWLEDAVHRIDGQPLPAGAFGDFPAARRAHLTLTGAYRRHLGHVRAQRNRVDSVAERAVVTADGFDAAEDDNRTLLRR